MPVKCVQCGTPFPPGSDSRESPEVVVCWACGYRRIHPKAGPRPMSFTIEAMRHYSSRRAALLGHRLWMDGLGLLLIVAGAAGALYLTENAPAVNWGAVTDTIARVPAFLAGRT